MVIMEPHKNMEQISINPQIDHTPIDDEMIILGEKSNQIYGLNSMGTTIFKLLEQEAMSFNEIYSALLKKYQVTPEQCAIDVRQFLQKMFQNNLLQMK